MNNGFVFYQDYMKYVQMIKDRDPDKVVDMLMAIINYGLYEKYDEGVNNDIDIAMIAIKQGIDNAHNRYDNARKNGQKGGSAGKSDYKAIYEAKVANGYTNGELAKMFGCAERTISRALKDVRENMSVYYPDKQDTEQDSQDISFKF